MSDAKRLKLFMMVVTVVWLLILVFGLVGHMDEHDAELRSAHCQHMVDIHAWPSEACL